MASEKTQDALHLREIVDPTAKSREDLHTMIRQVITEELGTSRAPAPAKEGSGESERLGRHGRTDPGLAAPGASAQPWLLKTDQASQGLSCVHTPASPRRLEATCSFCYGHNALGLTRWMYVAPQGLSQRSHLSTGAACASAPFG